MAGGSTRARRLRRLLTTHRVACFEDALQCVDWYRQRWHIEQLFRTLKKQGLDVEGSQVETGEGLTKLLCLAVQAAVRTMQLTLARDADSAAQAAWVVARLGGWKGYASETKPGPITMLRGLQRIEALCKGWKLARKDVCIEYPEGEGAKRWCMPNMISEDDIEQAILRKLKQDFGFELLNGHTSDADDLNDRSGRADKNVGMG